MGILVCEKSQRSLFRSFTLDTKFGEFLFIKLASSICGVIHFTLKDFPATHGIVVLTN